MSEHKSSRRAGPKAIAVVLVLLLALGITVSGAAAEGGQHHHQGPKPTVVLVHGAFADASGWDGVIERLQRRGYTVIAPANPLRGLASDAAYIGSVLDTITGPIVLVGHSYGGAVLTNAATGHTNVKALVYIAAFAPAEGDTVGGLVFMNPGSHLAQPDALVFRPHPGGVDGYVNPANFRDVFAADLSRETAALMAAGQRPGDSTTLAEPSGPPAWKTIPSWYLVASQDHLIPPATQRFMAQRAGATTIEVPSSHVAMISHPQESTNLIVRAANATT